MSEALDILDSLARCGVSIWAEGSRIRFRAAKGALPDELKQRLAANKSEVLAAWRERAASEVTSHPTTHAQRALWFLYQERPESPAYNVAIPFRIFSPLDVAAMERACQAVVDRHPSLRTTYAMDGTRLVQQVREYVPVSFQFHDRARVDVATLREEVIEKSHIPFSLEAGPLIRMDLFRRAEADYVLLVAVHHVAVDGWSGVLLMEDLRLNYIAETREGAAPPPRPENDVPAFARWQEQMLAGAEGMAHERYWTEMLAGELPVLELPTDWPRSAAGDVCGASLPIDLGAEVSAAVRALAVTAGTTPFVVLLAAYQGLLHRYTGSGQTIVGSPSYGRDHVEFADVIGDFVNTIPLKADFSGDPSFQELVNQMRKRVLEGLEDQDYPFALLVEKLHPVRDASRTPIFQTLFILNRHKQVAGLKDIFARQSGEARIDFGGLEVESFAVPHNEGQFDVALELVDFGGVYKGYVKYNADLFSPAMVTAFADHYAGLLRALVGSPDKRVSELPLLSAAEQHQILEEWNDTARDYSRKVCLHDLIAAQVDRTPDAVAVVFEGQQITYRELDERANQLARYLQKRGVTAETRVGISVERSLEMVIGLLGILKAGGAYVPMDPSYPEARLAFMLEDAGVKVLLAQKHLMPALKSAKTEIVCLDADWSLIADESRARPEHHANAENLAYMIYTSGSTGRPKGAMNEHRGIVNRLLWMQEEFRLTSTDAVVQKTPFSFDVSVWEFFAPLLAGARLVVARPEGHKDPSYLIDLVTRESVTIMHFVPSMLRIFLAAEGVERCTSLRDVICSGEALPADLVTRFYARSAATLHNLYGPTETAVEVTRWTCPRENDSSVVPIGRPIANTQCYILDRDLQPVPVGVPGELHLGGIQVGRGYHNRPELTAERFIRDPFGKQAGGRLYKTGDSCRYRRDGNIEYLGRLDHQVKIRGFRIELGEIEAALSANPKIREAVVVVREDVPGDQRLVAYFSASGDAKPSAKDLRAVLRASLPDYMVPSAFVQMERLPLNPSGKVDRKALPAPEDQLSSLAAGHTAPRNQIERIISEVWAEVLGVERVGIFENFFELGGHSLSATLTIARLKAAFQTDIPLRSVFIAPTIAELSNHILYDDLNQTYQYVAEIPNHGKRLVAAQPMGSRNPLYLVAGFMDADDTLRVLSRIFPHLGLQQPVFGFQPRWVDGHAQPYSTIEEVAREFVDELRAFQPEGPYLLGGDCVGGVVALEMAREILRQGERVGLLVMFDTQRPTALRAFLADLDVAKARGAHIAGVIRDIIVGKNGSRIEIIQDVVRRKRRSAQPQAQQAVQQEAQHQAPAPDTLYRLRMAYRRMIYRHRVKPYPGRITLMVNERQPKFDKTLGWDSLASGGLEVHSTRGDHWSRYTVHSKEFAKQLQECIERAQAEIVPQPAHPQNETRNQEGALVNLQLDANARR